MMKPRKYPRTRTRSALPTAALNREISGEIALPATVLEAAEKAPRVFHIAAYYRPIRVMRDKGYSWRELAEWLEQFNIQVSYVHLRRLFLHEDDRLSQLNEEEQRELGMPEDMIQEWKTLRDPAGRLGAADPEEDADGGGKKR
jgi:hypothetical protein